MSILTRLAAANGERTTTRVCEVCAEVVAVDGAAIMLMTGDVARGSIATSDAVAARVDDLQFTLGEGSCVDAYHRGRPEMEADLADRYGTLARLRRRRPGGLHGWRASTTGDAGT